VFSSIDQWKRALPSFFLLASACLASHCAWSAGHYTTKTTYQPQQHQATYEPVPNGFVPIHTQLVARHGSRGLSGMKADVALLNLWKLAQQQNALTPLGERLGPQLEKLIEVNALLGYGVLSSPPGYGNLSLRGVQEHEALAQRMLQRLPSLFAQIEDAAMTSSVPAIRVQHSGVNRAKDSAQSFVNSLVNQKPKLKPLIDSPTVDRFLLYFHRLNERTDAANKVSNQNAKTFKSSLAYQAYSKSVRVSSKVDSIQNSDDMRSAAKSVLSRLFKPAFLESLQNGKLSASNTGKFSFKTKDGLYQAQLEGDGRTQIRTPIDVLLALSSVYEIAPSLQHELGFDFDAYFTTSEAKVVAEANDAEDFYVKGPGIAEDEPVNHAMAEGLLQDFFEQIKKTNQSTLGASVSLRFTHAEIIVPFASILKIPALTNPLPFSQSYSYAKSDWRGELVAPFAANVQWDTFRNSQGSLIVRMLYNEKETNFKPQCNSAKLHPQSYFYEFNALKTCYSAQ
jgi:hypothetical protein